MRKLTALLLAVLLCLSFAACGGEKAEVAVSTSTSSDLQSTDNTTNNSTSVSNTDTDADTSTDDATDPNVEAIKEVLVGKWLPINNNKFEDGSNIITFNADGTIDMLGESYTWEVTSADSAEEGYLALYDGETKFYKGEYKIKDKVLNHLQFERVKGADEKYSLVPEFSNYAPSYYKESDFKVIEINSENFADYFEYNTYTQVKKDSFDEAEKITIYYGYVLKEEFGAVCGNISQSAFEYSYAQNIHSFTANKTTAEYEVGDATREFPASTKMEDNANQANLEDHYGFIIDYSIISKFPTDECNYPDNFEILRATGTIYTYTPAEE